jgi:tetratricopeptide (TPR) repeat protein
MNHRSVTFLTALLVAILPTPAGADPPRHDCDLLAASPNDHEALAPAVVPEEMSVEEAIQACRAALHEFPDTPRFEAQLANALFVARRYDESLEWFRKAAGHGYAFGMYSLGSMYRSGEGLPQDADQAAVWFRRAAGQGNLMAAYGLGWMYQEGRGVPQDDAQALAWYRQAADRGEARAQYAVGWMHEQGRGVPQDKAEAVVWYRKAARQGNSLAQAALEKVSN